ncbi:MAG: hypothetical protein F6K47_17885 [Symploca sp. SIO2E6]|nr:hypothetical protein [Symploca sp. SIO2E6]
MVMWERFWSKIGQHFTQPTLLVRLGVILGSKIVILGSKIVILGSKIVILGSKIVILGSKIVILGSKIVILGSKIVILGSKMLPLQKFSTTHRMRSHPCQDKIRNKFDIFVGAGLAQPLSHLRITFGQNPPSR